MEENIYEFEFTESNDIGVFNISLVDNPAIKTNFVYFNEEQKIEWKMANQEKQLVVSPVLIPDQKIYRRNINGKEGYVFASQNTIEKLQQNFSKQRFGNTSSINHAIPVEGVYVSESWLISDPNNDKANAVGFKGLPVGTWMVSMKVDNPVVWEDFVKSGEVKGLSMEALLNSHPITEKQKQTNMNDEAIVETPQTINDIVDKAIEEVPVELAQEVVAAPATDAPAEPGVVEGVVVEKSIIDQSVPEEDVQKLKSLIMEYENYIGELEAKNVELEAKLVTVEEEQVLLSNETPASKGIIDLPTFSDEVEVKGILAAIRKSNAK